MQSNIYTSKIHKTSKHKQDTSKESTKEAYKGRDKVAIWNRGTDKRAMTFDGSETR